MVDLLEGELDSDAENGVPDLMQRSIYYNNEEFTELLKTKDDVIKVLSLNVQSLNAKIDQLRIFLQMLQGSCDLDIICLQETWLSESSDISHLQLDGYTLISKGKLCSAHGGVAIFLNCKYSYDVLSVQSNSNCWDGIFLEIELENRKLIVGNIYRPPRNLIENYSTFCDELNDVLSAFNRCRHEVIICGDFNLDLLKLNENQHVHDYFETILSNGFLPKITLPTRFSEQNSTLIDNIFIKLSSRLSETTAGVLMHNMSDHQPCFVTLDYLKNIKDRCKYVKIRRNDMTSLLNFRYEIGNQCLSDLSGMNVSGDPNESYNLLNTIINKALITHLPMKNVKFNKHKHKKSNWITAGIIQSIRQRDKLYSEFKSLNVSHQQYALKRDNLKNFNRILKQSIRSAKRSYYLACFNKFRDNIKKTWETINCIINRDKNRCEFPASFIIDDIEVTDTKQIADEFNKFYVNIGPSLASKITTFQNKSFADYLDDTVNALFSFSPIDKGKVMKIINDLKAKTSSGVDGLSNKLLKFIAEEICGPLVVIINQCFQTAIFPDELKVAKVIPLFKKGNPQKVENYRPVSLLPSISKVIEKVMHMQIYEHFMQNSLFYTSQYGFRPQHSTELATLELIDQVIKQMDDNKVPLNVYLDLSKAFDTLDHGILLHKLKYYGFKGKSFHLMKSYLEKRKQFVSINDNNSECCEITTGVPQGSVLGPLLFLIYMNDIVCSGSCFRLVIYADDTTLNTTLNYFGDLGNDSDVEINLELAKIHDWLKVNKLSLNISKTKFMLFFAPQRKVRTPCLKIDNHIIDIVDEFNFLGVILDKHLNWKSQVNAVSKKISRVAGVLCRLRNYIPQNISLTIYNSLILPYLNYGILLWGHKIESLFKLQKRVTRVITCSRFNAHTEPLFKRLKMLKVTHLRALHELKFCYKLENHVLPHYFLNDLFIKNRSIHGYSTRHSNNFQLPRVKHAFAKNGLYFRIPFIFNNTAQSIIEKIYTHSKAGFSAYVKNHFLNSYHTNCIIRNCYVCNH